MVARPVLAEVFKDVGKGRFGHSDLEEVVAEGNLIGS